MHVRNKSFIVILLLLVLQVVGAYGKITPEKYGITISDPVVVNASAVNVLDSFYRQHPLLSSKGYIVNIARTHTYPDKTNAFYLILFLCLLLGSIRYSDRRYFQNLWKAFWNPTLSNRQLRDQLESVPLPSLLMNIFFVASTGAYIYYVGLITFPQRSVVIAPSLLVLILIGGVMVIYLVKYATIRFSGWAFRLESITSQYLFNVFLINKILGIVLLPFVVILAFAGSAFIQPAIILSFTLAIVLFANRYIRSWQVFRSFFKYGKFHFFMYLCASELLPLAVLMKLLVRGLLYY